MATGGPGLDPGARSFLQRPVSASPCWPDGGSPDVALDRVGEGQVVRFGKVPPGGLRSGGVAWWSRVARATGAPRARCRRPRGVRLPRVLGRCDVGRGSCAATGAAGLGFTRFHHRRREVCGVRAAGTIPPGAIGAIAEAALGKGAVAGVTVGPAQAGKRPSVLEAPLHEGCRRGELFQAVLVTAHGWPGPRTAAA